jgi:sulfite reductase (NADPH) hemoprotein beta-component
MLLSAYGVKTEKQASVLHAASMACPALPTCGLALAESERMLPGFIDRIEKLLAETGLTGEEIIIRSTGCPNGCARPYMAEIAFRRQSARTLSGLAGRRCGRHCG